MPTSFTPTPGLPLPPPLLLLLLVQVNEYDCLLLEHVFGNRPDDGSKVRAAVLDQVAADPGLQQVG